MIKIVDVLKRSKKKQRFMPAKIKSSIEKSAKDAKLSAKRVEQLVTDVAEPVITFAKKKDVVKTIDLRRSVLGRLERRSKKVAAAWRKFEKKRRG